MVDAATTIPSLSLMAAVLLLFIVTVAEAVVDGGDSSCQQRWRRGARVTRAGADDGARVSARPTRARAGQGRRRAQWQGRGWIDIDINDSISGSRSSTRGMHDDDNDDEKTINAGGCTDVPKR